MHRFRLALALLAGFSGIAGFPIHGAAVVTAVPEPATFARTGAGMVGLAAVRRR